MAKMMQEVVENVAAADAAFRETHGGLPVDVVIADFPTHGPALDLPPAVLRQYAEAVSSGAEFEWKLFG